MADSGSSAFRWIVPACCLSFTRTWAARNCSIPTRCLKDDTQLRAIPIDPYASVCICMCMHIDAFQTLGDPTRRHVVDVLRNGERQVNDIVREVGIHQSGVSRHLRILLEAGFVSVRPDGPRRLYSLRPDPFREIDAWLSKYRQLWEARLDRFGAVLQERQQQRRPRGIVEDE